MHVLFAAALAADDGFRPVRTAAGCAIAMRPESDPAGPAMRAACRWPEVDPRAFEGMVLAYDRYPDFVFALTEARIERRDADRTLVYQRQRVAGTSPREVLLWMSAARQEDGALEVVWTAASEEPLQLEAGAIRTPRNDGHWRIWADPAGGAVVEHQIAVDGGGSVPRWLVQLARNWAYTKILSDTRAHAASLPAP